MTTDRAEAEDRDALARLGPHHLQYGTGEPPASDGNRPQRWSRSGRETAAADLPDAGIDPAVH